MGWEVGKRAGWGERRPACVLVACGAQALGSRAWYASLPLPACAVMSTPGRHNLQVGCRSVRQPPANSRQPRGRLPASAGSQKSESARCRKSWL